MIYLKVEKIKGHEQQMKTLANGEIKILTGAKIGFDKLYKY